MGEEFSKRALERHRKDGAPLKCKQCMAASEQAERETAQTRRKNLDDIDSNEEKRKCAGDCGRDLSQSFFNRNQWTKGHGKSRCIDCVDKAIQDEAALRNKSKAEKIAAATQRVEDAKSSGDTSKIVAAESVLAALEAEKVTGLKPVKLSSGRGRGRGRIGSGRGRGRGPR